MKNIQSNEIYKKNLEAFCNEYPESQELLNNIEQGEHEFVIQQVPVLSITDSQNRTLLLGGIYEPLALAKENLEKWRIIPNKAPFFIIGMNKLEEIRYYLKHAPEDSAFFIYEPSIEIFEYVMKYCSIQDVISDPRVILSVNGNKDENEDYKFEEKLEENLNLLIQLDTIAMLKIIVSPNYQELFQDKVRMALKLVTKVHTHILTYWRTSIFYTDIAGVNVCTNIKHQFNGYNITQLKGMLAGEVPAIVISAGPSLNNNIEDLRQAKGRACLIAVDTAIKPLLNRDIIPDFFVIVDGLKPTELMNHPRISEITLITASDVASGIMDLHHGKKIFVGSNAYLEFELYKAARKGAGKTKNLYSHLLPTGGSVANTAFSVADYMNASEIILVGQDLALTNGCTHADGTFKEKMPVLSREEIEEVVEVEGIDGTMILSMADFKFYLEWFEDAIKKGRMDNVTDATQGGAKIHGAKLMTLQEAIDRFCTKEVMVKMDACLESMQKMMDWGAKNAVIEWYQKIPDNIHKVYLEAKKAEQLYQQLESMVSKPNYDKEKYRKLVKKIGRTNAYMNTDHYALFIQSTMMQLNYIMRLSIYEEDLDECENIVSIAEQGQTMNYYIKESAQKWEEDSRRILKERPLTVDSKDIQGPLDQMQYELQIK
ncbi:MAG: 6-hydroxymethylpterin diphosphokinase MptE-like protein, partial [Lachnospiraceae bacterium]